MIPISLSWNSNNNSHDDTKWMETYQRLMLMGFNEELALDAAQKYKTVEKCIDHLIIIKKEDNTQSYSIRSMFQSMYKMIYNDTESINTTNISCKCGAKMVVKNAKECYEGTNYLYVICDECDQKCAENTDVYHCPQFKVDAHPEGYDICAQCVNKLDDATITENVDITHDHEMSDDENESTQMIIDINEEKKEHDIHHTIKRALIIQTISNKDNVECQDADALSKLFKSLQYKVTVISPAKATKECINSTIDTLYASDQVEQSPTFTVICYSGHGILRDDVFHFCLNKYDEYSSIDLYQRIHRNLSMSTLMKDVMNMMTGHKQQNETLLIVNACHSGAIQKPLKAHEYIKTEVKMWTKQKLPILMAFAAVAALCYAVSKVDKHSETMKVAEEAVDVAVKSVETITVKSANNPPEPQSVETDQNAAESKDGYDYARELMEREMDESADLDFNDLGNEIKNKYNDIKERFKGKISWKQFRKTAAEKLIKQAQKLMNKKAKIQTDSVHNMDNMEAKMSHESGVSSIESKAKQIDVQRTNSLTMEEATDSKTWECFARYLEECRWENVLKNSGSLLGPIYGLLASAISVGAIWLHIKNKNKVQLLGSCEKDESSNFAGCISPFVQYVIDAICKMEKEKESGTRLDIAELYGYIMHDASHKDVCGGVTLHGMEQHPVVHHTPN